MSKHILSFQKFSKSEDFTVEFHTSMTFRMVNILYSPYECPGTTLTKKTNIWLTAKDFTLSHGNSSGNPTKFCDAIQVGRSQILFEASGEIQIRFQKE